MKALSSIRTILTMITSGIFMGETKSEVAEDALMVIELVCENESAFTNINHSVEQSSSIITNSPTQ